MPPQFALLSLRPPNGFRLSPEPGVLERAVRATLPVSEDGRHKRVSLVSSAGTSSAGSAAAPCRACAPRSPHRRRRQGTYGDLVESEQGSPCSDCMSVGLSSPTLAAAMTLRLSRLGRSWRPGQPPPPAEPLLAEQLFRTFPLFRQLASGYVSLYQIARSASSPHVLCLPPDGESMDEDTISYPCVQAHMLMPVVGKGDDWRDWVYRSLLNDGEEVTVTSTGGAHSLCIRRRASAPLVAGAAGQRGRAAGSTTPRRPLHTSRQSLRARGGAADQETPDVVLPCLRWARIEDSSLHVVWLKYPIIATPKRKPSMWRRPSVSAAHVAALVRRVGTSRANLSSADCLSGSRAGMSMTSRGFSSPQRQVSMRSPLMDTRVTFAALPSVESAAEAMSVGSSQGMDDPPGTTLATSFGQSLLSMSFRLQEPRKPASRPATLQQFVSYLQKRASRSSRAGDVLASMDAELQILNSSYFFPPDDLAHLTPAKLCYLCESFAEDYRLAALDADSSPRLGDHSPSAVSRGSSDNKGSSNRTLPAPSADQCCSRPRERVRQGTVVVGDDGVVATIGGGGGSTEDEEEAEVLEQAVHSYLTSKAHHLVFARWVALHAEREREFADICSELANLSWEDWSIPEGFRGDQRRAVRKCRRIASSCYTPLQMGQELAAITLAVLEDSVGAAEDGQDLAAEASADLLLPLLMRVIAIATDATPASPGSSPRDHGEPTLLTVLAYVKDFGCPSMGFSNVAYAAASFEAATEFIASGACGTMFRTDASL
eukprot:TRINITY_DN39701_c0_g1_i1.p1 TRINITY_DN39701_c0_g1~~TRINITY_DN39701_c0_g1_i1.p1  ORF type:complete len:770 (+),score=202.04 TRINITY_DN39701_c0_g1_i1:190-2499(+)